MIIETVTLHAADLVALKAFYGEQIGLPTTLSNQEKQLTVTIGTSQLIFLHKPDFTGHYHFAFNIPEDKLAAAEAFLKDRDIALIVNADGETVFDFDFWDAHSLYFYDVAGNIAECVARHELKNKSSIRENFSPEEMLCISEIALPSGDVFRLGTALSDILGVEPYRETSSSFVPLGNAEGLLILVQVGRIWFPDTGIPAETYPVQVAVHSPSGARFIIHDYPYRITRLEDFCHSQPSAMHHPSIA